MEVFTRDTQWRKRAERLDPSFRIYECRYHCAPCADQSLRSSVAMAFSSWAIAKTIESATPSLGSQNALFEIPGNGASSCRPGRTRCSRISAEKSDSMSLRNSAPYSAAAATLSRKYADLMVIALPLGRMLLVSLFQTSA